MIWVVETLKKYLQSDVHTCHNAIGVGGVRSLMSCYERPFVQSHSGSSTTQPTAKIWNDITAHNYSILFMHHTDIARNIN
jgi:hypothetical protein